MARTALVVPADEHALRLPERGRLTETSLELPPGMPEDEWLHAGEALDRMERGVHWWIGDWGTYGEIAYGDRVRQADAVGFSTRSVRRDVQVARTFEPGRRRPHLPWAVHAEIAAAGLSVEDQERWLDRAEAEELTVAEMRGALQAAAMPAIDERPVLPGGRFDVILADPPWRYFDGEVRADPLVRSIESHYPTLPLEEILAYRDAEGRPVQDLAADDAVLYLWATVPLLREGLETMAAWGFEYRTHISWVKPRMGMGSVVRHQHEPLLIGFRGDPGVPRPAARPRSVLTAPYRGHSVKPPEAYELIERMYPDASRVELFARATRPGWAAFGNQVDAGVR